MRKFIRSYIVVPMLAYAVFLGVSRGIVTAGDVIDARNTHK